MSYLTAFRWIMLTDSTASDVVYMNILGQSIVILNSWEAINDLIEKRSNLYSSR